MRSCVSCRTSFEGAAWRCPACGFGPMQVGHVLSFATPHGAEGFEPTAFAHLVELEDSSFWFRSRNRLIAWAVTQHFPAARRMLETGCGTGYVLEGLRAALPHLRLVGAELHMEGLEHAATRVPGVELMQFDARRIPFQAEFDVVGAFDVLEHIDADDEVLSEAHRSLAPGGGIVLTVPQHPRLWSATDEYAEHKRRYRRDELLHKLRSTGFEPRRITSFVSLLLPAMVVSRLRERLSKRPFDPRREHAAAERASRSLERVLDAERYLIRHGVNLPGGGSLLVVAART